ncbi:MAG: hypothetical protein HY292_08875 [Planctomycetes bacterium]|nr:hypothetical protein [Planctomycetota bacterium]
MRNRIVVVLACAVVSGLALTNPARAQDPSPIPIRRVVLYKHGVGYFERSGPAKSGVPVELRFRAGQMNDVLKSLTTIMRGGGHVSAIAYDSTKTIDRLLGEFSFDLRKDEGLPGLLRQLRGSRLDLQVGSQTVSGSLLAVEKRMEGPPENRIETYRITVMTDGLGIQSFNLADVQSVKFKEEALNKDLARYAEILSSTHKRDEKIVRIQADADGDLFAAYTVEVPVWKASYRVVLDEKKQPLLQGWAIVDNTEEEDWNNVQLSLVSGLPVSFVMNLYDPRYKRRPAIEIEEEVSVNPQTHEESLERKPASAPAEKAAALGYVGDGGGRTAKRRGGAANASSGKAGDRDKLKDASGFEDDATASELSMTAADMREQLEQQSAQTIASEVGDLFEYKIDHPITIQRNRSAMIPIVNSTFEGERVSIYNPAMRKDNPLAALKMKNSTGLTLEGGPLTILEGATYAGEAIMTTTKANEERFISYAVDLGVKIAMESQSQPERVHLVQIYRGNLFTHYKLVTTTTYTIANKDDQPRKVYLEHSKKPDWNLRDTTAPVETTEHLYRFLVEVKAGETVKFPVKEEHAESSTYGLSNMTDENLQLFIQQRILNDDVGKVLRKVLDLKGQISSLDQQMARSAQGKAQIFQDQERLRQNMTSLRDNADERSLRAKYVKKLEEGEARIAALDEAFAALQSQRVDVQKQLDDLLANYGTEYRP